MKKNIVHAALSLCMLIVFTTPVYPQWVQTNWPATNSFFNFYTSQDRVFARTWDSLNGGRMFFTADNGANWTRISSADSGIDILSIVMLNNSMLAGTWNGFYRSVFGGTNWNAVTPAGIPADTAIWSIAMIDTTIFAGTMGAIYKSSDSGITWTEARSGIPVNARIRSIIASGNAIFACSDSSGVFRTTNNAASWTAINSGLTDKRIFQLAAMGTKLFAVTLTGVFVSGNSGASWAANGPGLKNIDCFFVVNNQLFAGTDSSGVYLSADSGATWTSFNSGMPAGSRVWSLAASSGNIFAGTSSGVWRTPISTTQVNKSGTARLTCSRLQFRRQNGPWATIEFALSVPETANLEVYDLCGHKIVHKRFGAGLQCVLFNTGSFAPGLYILKLTAGMTVYQQAIPMLRQLQ
jgi:hypothetical protein